MEITHVIHRAQQRLSRITPVDRYRKEKPCPNVVQPDLPLLGDVRPVDLIRLGRHDRLRKFVVGQQIANKLS
jgi:hypothetical protein